VQVRTKHVAAEDPTHQMHDALELPSIRPARVSSSSAHKSTLDTPSVERSACRSHPVANTWNRWEMASIGLYWDCACSCRRCGSALVQSRSRNAQSTLAGPHVQRGLGLSKESLELSPHTTSRACRPRCVRLEARRSNTPPHGEGLGSLYADRYGLEVVNLRIVGFSLEPTEPAHMWGWLSPGDTVRLVTAALTAPSVHVVTCYGLSRNTRRFYTDDGWAELGYDPQDDAEQYADRWPDAAPPALQGMNFTDPNYAGD
jgi:hypothetical protein